jgi:hypothetical protein
VSDKREWWTAVPRLAAPEQRRALETIANGSPALFLIHGVYRSCSLCAAHIEVARVSLGWASIPEMAGVPRPWHVGMLSHLQWPAMVLSVLGSWFVADVSPSLRMLGFALFLAANVAWLVWGWHTRAWALVIMQAVFTLTSLRGIWSNA